MKLHKVDLSNYSRIEFNVSINDSGTIMLAEISGTYRNGSEGNPDGLYLYSALASHYFAFEPISVILDIRRLNYDWGNTLLRTLNFFSETGRGNEERDRTLIIIVSDENREAISGLLKMINSGNRILCNTCEKAFDLADMYVREFLQ